MADVFTGFIQRGFDNARHRMRERGVDRADMDLGAREIAFRMTADRLGLSPRLDELLAALGAYTWPIAARSETIVELLDRARLGIVAEKDGVRRFSFRPHRQFHEPFATEAVRQQPGRLESRTLLWAEQ